MSTCPGDEKKPNCKSFKDKKKSKHHDCEAPKCKAQQSPLQEFISGVRSQYHYPPFVRSWGPRSTHVLKQFLPGLAVYGAASLIGLIYFSEWKALLQYMPYYNGKYKDSNEEKKIIQPVQTEEKPE